MPPLVSLPSPFPSKVLLSRTRTFERYSAYQRSQLEQAYQRSRFISYEQKDQLARSLGLSKNQIQFWFQNRRSKEKKLLQKHKFPSHFGR
ncbi:caudal type homeobox protein, putative [Ixodes scapularis]|uniref:Caudal type homeobox protein, putative n=2 Tax=Ixodes TaxID=6944 RepID=B7PY37_IXOSC|nr:caudal type homeobox protein, putative [Ixodes scapularis]|eukprot:XP_002402535.1 caudal type homeobox protein, putative [Ixodes scapularis]